MSKDWVAVRKDQKGMQLDFILDTCYWTYNNEPTVGCANKIELSISSRGYKYTQLFLPRFHPPFGQDCTRRSFFMPDADMVQIRYQSMAIIDIQCAENCLALSSDPKSGGQVENMCEHGDVAVQVANLDLRYHPAAYN
jgi:hypothetical protein